MRSLIAFAAIVVVAGCATEPRLVGPQDDGTVVTPTNQLIAPAGATVEFAGRPVDVAVAPDGDTVYAKDNRGVVVIDAETWMVRQELPFENGSGGSMHGLVLSTDGETLYATSAGDRLEIARVSGKGLLKWENSIVLPGPSGDDSHPTGIALDESKNIAYVCLSRNNAVAIVDLAASRVTGILALGIAPYDIALSPDRTRAYVSNWGGRKPQEGEGSAPSSGTDVLVDERGVGASGTVSLIDLSTDSEIARVDTGLHPSDLVLSDEGRTLFVANANSDTITVIDTDSFEVTHTWSTRPHVDLPFGSMPNALALDESNGILYAANGGNNSVAAIALDTGEIRGHIPAGWFPAGMAMHGDTLFVANVKGVGSRTRRRGPDGGWNVHGHRGTVTKVTVPDAEELARMTRRVMRDVRAPEILRAWERGQSEVAPVAVPAKLGEPSVFEHVIYVIKENRTYDQIFGDMPQGNGDPSLCIYPRKITPNHHALAEEFVLLDNYYCNGVNSADGHSWSTEGIVTDHLEKSFGGFTRSYTFGDDPLTYASTGFIWDNVLVSGLSFRNYGEFDYAEPVPPDTTFDEIYLDYLTGERTIEFTQNIGVDRLRQFSAREYPGWNMRIPDVLRVSVFLEELEEFVRQGSMPNFMIVYLPQDHTTGTTPGAPTPQAHMADNDLALGQLVEGVSNSPFWRKTCIFVIEDDPQDGFDHVDGHRSICLTISPYSKRSAVVSQFYNQSSVLHTMQRILGVPPMNQMDARSPLMTACFLDTPDFTPYTARPSNVPLDQANPPKEALSGPALFWAEKSEAEPFHKFDMADEDTLNRILWFAMKGDTPYPADMAGAHGKGLTELNLEFEVGGDD